MSILKVISAVFFQLLVLLCGLASNIPRPISTSQINHNSSFLANDFLSPLVSSPMAQEETSNIIINAINPGYTTDAGKNSGEFIELINLSGEEVSLNNLAIIYTAKPTTTSPNGKSTILYQFPVGSKMIGETILLRYESSPETAEGNQDLTYSTSIAMAGSLTLIRLDNIQNLEVLISTTSDLSHFGEIESSVCWTGGENCLPSFSTTVKSRSYTTIVRNSETEEYEHVSEYLLYYDVESSGLYLPPEPEAVVEEPTLESTTKKPSTDVFDFDKDTQCQGLIFSEILSYYDEDVKEQFIELYNSTNSNINISGCKVRYKNKFYDLSTENSDSIIEASDYHVIYPEFQLTKNPNTDNTIELYDVNGTIIGTLVYPHGQKKSAAYALINYNDDGTANWQVTYAVTPGEPNIYQQYRICPAGKVINETTGNCVKATTISGTVADCPAGKYRNPTTGRCKNIDDDTGSSECKEGYERNPETGRCRKIKDNSGAKYPVVPVTGIEEKSVFIGLLAILGIVIIGAGYIVFQFRREIAHFFRKFVSKNKH